MLSNADEWIPGSNEDVLYWQRIRSIRFVEQIKQSNGFSGQQPFRLSTWVDFGQCVWCRHVEMIICVTSSYTPLTQATSTSDVETGIISITCTTLVITNLYNRKLYHIVAMHTLLFKYISFMYMSKCIHSYVCYSVAFMCVEFLLFMCW